MLPTRFDKFSHNLYYHAPVMENQNQNPNNPIPKMQLSELKIGVSIVTVTVRDSFIKKKRVTVRDENGNASQSTLQWQWFPSGRLIWNFFDTIVLVGVSFGYALRLSLPMAVFLSNSSLEHKTLKWWPTTSINRINGRWFSFENLRPCVCTF